MTPITEKTTLSIGLLVTLLGGASYVTYAVFQSNANARDITEIKTRQEALDEIKLDVAVIRAKVESIEKNLEGGK